MDLSGLEEEARSLGRVIKDVMPEGIGYFLLMFTFGEGGWATFVSNAEREDMIKAIEELLQRLKDDPNR